MKEYYARTIEGRPSEDWQLLRRHLDSVAEMACEFARAFDSHEWGWCAGMWHDLGKYREEFQRKLRGESISAEHSGAGAAFVFGRDNDRNKLGLPLAFVIAAHHAGLANLGTNDVGLPKSLKERLKENRPILESILPIVPSNITDHPLPKQLPAFLNPATPDADQARRAELWTRFLFSALVDADRLDSERFCDPQKAAHRTQYTSLTILSERLDTFIAGIRFRRQESSDLAVNRVREHVLDASRNAAAQPPGIFTLTVPTGGGKTLSAMSFALRHANQHGLRRVIVVIPYTSIIEQNAAVYRDALGADAVIEHHSNLDPVFRRTNLGEGIANREELATENWDAPVIVTTTVQFFESLFSNRPSRCRKLHNIARSVIILDEVQTLPPEFLDSILDALNELARAYHCSVVLATATPPALKWRDSLPQGLRSCREVIPNPAALSRELRRVTYCWPESSAQWGTDELAARLAAHRQVLAIVHRRQDARETAQCLSTLVGNKSVFHLSALMCPAHRSRVLREIRHLLREGAACHVVSTQLVEAGVDLDFPIVYRALGGLDSIVQAAGRCNREGRLDSNEARVIVFRAESSPPRGTPRKALETTEQILNEHSEAIDLDDPRIFEDYFRTLYFAHDTDMRNIQAMREQFEFASVGRDFRLIEDAFTETVVVPFGDAPTRLDDFRRLGPSKVRYRSLQPFTINIYPTAFQKLLAVGALEEVGKDTSMFALTFPFHHLYDSKYGLTTGDEPSPAVEALVC